MEKDYSQNIVKEYKYWQVKVNDNQSYLGRCVIWCKREDALQLTDATKEEQEELFVIIKELREAQEKAFGSDWFNYAFLGNATRHLHGHFIPRYKEPKEFMGITFEDERWGQNFRTDKDFKTPEEVLFAIRDKLKENL